MNDNQRDELLTNMSNNVSTINNDVKSIKKKVGGRICEVYENLVESISDIYFPNKQNK